MNNKKNLETVTHNSLNNIVPFPNACAKVSNTSDVFNLLPEMKPALIQKKDPERTEPNSQNSLPIPELKDITLKIKRFVSKNNNEFLFDDSFNTQLFKEVFFGELLFCKEKGIWLVYNGIRWVEDREDHVKKCIMQLAEVVANVVCTWVVEKKDPIYKKAADWCSQKVQNNVFKSASTLMSVSAKKFDTKNNLLNCRNGTIELFSDGYILREHRPQDLLTKCADVDFFPNASSRKFDDFLVSTMQVKALGEKTEVDYKDETEQKVEYLQRMTGYCLSGTNPEECFFILHGNGRNGKGVFTHAISQMLGTYATAAMPSTFARGMSARSGAASEDVARLAGHRFISVPEPEKDYPLNEAFIKAITGADLVIARQLYKSSFEFQMSGKIVMSTNHFPRITDKTVFTTKRIILIPFERVFSEQEQEKTLKTCLVSEESKSAILKWALDGYKAQCSKSIKEMPASIQAAIEAFQMTVINAKQFVSEGLEEVTGEIIPCTTTEAYEAYKGWCEDKQLPPESQEAFNNEVRTVTKIARKQFLGQGKKSYILGRRLRV